MNYENINIDEVIKRINELAKKSKNEGLNDIERAEQQKLRRIYIDNIKGSLKAHLENIELKRNNKG
ncbi:DUF896 domain-containing protein [Caproiciproducens sp. MSJ-32]|uniref:DUF896 domain-containing protein n=1 Tax=Caproiciproducens sp. MSJ-32 TaxID=2841527 RepID=UPI001C11E4F0|nr:DUF896 domain-containing protein [Caproiciproducens sp. MSJ-32]MBU5454404.1 DUF896 domain-containing protein [Caproiciproducens sp. MSJ-32]